MTAPLNDDFNGLKDKRETLKQVQGDRVREKY